MHSSEMRGLCIMKWASKMLQNLPYFWNTKFHVHFNENDKIEHKMKKKEQIKLVFTCSITIFEPFTFVISFNINFRFLKSAQLGYNNKYILVKQAVKHPLHLDNDVQI